MTVEMPQLNKPIEVLVVFEQDGRPTPLKFRYHDEDGEVYVVKVEKVLSVDEQCPAPGTNVLMFRCLSYKACAPYQYDLSFSSKTMRWQLFWM